MSAHVTLHPDTAPTSSVICEECHLDQTYPRTKTAQAAARRHNLDQHAFPEQTLDLGGTA